MILQGYCSKCQTLVKLDIGFMTKDEVIDKLRSMQGFECPGHHVELSSPYPAYWNADEWELVEGQALTEEQFLAQLRADHTEVRSTEEMQGIITGFAYGFPITNDGNEWNFCSSPDGKRYYYR